MENKQTDKLIEQIKEAVLRASESSDKSEVDAVLTDLEAALWERINAERLEAAARLAGWLAHRINNPLGAISGNAQLLARRLQRDNGFESVDPYLRYIDAIQEQTERSARITGELLEFTKPRDVIPRITDLREVTEDAVELAMYGRGQTEVFVDWDSVRTLPEALTDKELLVRALYEVVLNAMLAAGDEGTVHISADGLSMPKWLQIVVKDNGAGVPEDAVRRIFDPFFSTREKARGLGLTASLAIMRQLGGTVDLVETSPSGTTMVIRIPVGGRDE